MQEGRLSPMKWSGAGTPLQDPEPDSVTRDTWEHRNSCDSTIVSRKLQYPTKFWKQNYPHKQHRTDLELISFYALFPTVQHRKHWASEKKKRKHPSASTMLANPWIIYHTERSLLLQSRSLSLKQWDKLIKGVNTISKVTFNTIEFTATLGLHREI